MPRNAAVRPKRLQDLDLPGRVVQVLVAPDHVRDAHVRRTLVKCQTVLRHWHEIRVFTKNPPDIDPRSPE